MFMTLKQLRTFSLGLSLTALLGFTSCGSDNSSNIEIPGVDGPKVSLLQDKMIVSMTFEAIELDGGLRYSIPRYPNSWLEIAPDLETNGTNMTMSLAISDILNSDLLLLDPQSLPGGRALPGVRTGALPSVAFSVENFNNMSFYVGPEVFGFFIPANLGIDNGIASFRYYIGEKRAGTISLVGADTNDENSGLLLMLDMNANTKRSLRKYLNKF